MNATSRDRGGFVPRACNVARAQHGHRRPHHSVRRHTSLTCPYGIRCVAEEGLDIGAVDLIISFDALTSPTRMVQRMGRTGRHRTGRVIILATKGSEEKKVRAES